VFDSIERKQRTVHGDRSYHEAVPRPDPHRADALADRRIELRRTTDDRERRLALGIYESLLAR
jgi:hypothetical protein